MSAIEYLHICIGCLSASCAYLGNSLCLGPRADLSQGCALLCACSSRYFRFPVNNGSSNFCEHAGTRQNCTCRDNFRIVFSHFTIFPHLPSPLLLVVQIYWGVRWCTLDYSGLSWQWHWHFSPKKSHCNMSQKQTKVQLKGIWICWSKPSFFRIRPWL